MTRSIELNTSEIDTYKTALALDTQHPGPDIPNNVFCALRDILARRGLNAFPKEVTVEYGFPATVFRLYFSEVQRNDF